MELENNMEHICLICAKQPDSHSFSYIGEHAGNSVLYSCPGIASKYYDTEGILTHVDNMLANIGNHPWIWIFDCSGFNMSHALEYRVAVGLSELITHKYGSTLQKIWIINPSWMIRISMQIVYPFLTNRTRELIEETDKTLDEVLNVV